MNTVSKTQMILTGIAGGLLAVTAAAALPFGVEIVAGLAVAGALGVMGALDLKERAY